MCIVTLCHKLSKTTIIFKFISVIIYSIFSLNYYFQWYDNLILWYIKLDNWKKIKKIKERKKGRQGFACKPALKREKGWRIQTYLLNSVGAKWPDRLSNSDPEHMQIHTNPFL